MGQCTIPSLISTSKEIDVQVETIERKISKADVTIRHYVERASHDPVAKQRALQAMKRKKMLEAQRQDLIGAQFNVDSLADQQEQAKFTLRAVEAMRKGRDDLKQDQSRMDVRQVEEMLDQTEDMADEMRAISESLARGSDQASMEAELMQLQREYGMAVGPPLGAGVGSNALPSLQPERAASTSRARARAPAEQPAGVQRSSSATQPWYGDSPAAEGQGARAYAEAPLPPPPPPPPPPVGTQVPASPAKSVDQQQADLWAASALSAAMAPHGHLPYPGPTPARPPAYPPRMAVAATFY